MTRFVTLLCLFLLSLLTVFKAPAYPFWLVAICVSEYGWVFAIGTFIIFLTGINKRRLALAGTILGGVAMLLFLSPIVRAYSIARHLKQDMDSAFSISPDAGKALPFSLKRLIKHNNSIPYRRFTYIKYPDTTLTLDYYRTSTSGKRPCVIIIHGGSWSGGDSQQLPELSSTLAQSGYQVASINYRLAPKNHSPAPITDVNHALAFLRKQAEHLQIDTNQFVLLGRSAGGQIALLAAYTASARSGIKGVIDFYGPADMVWGYAAPANPLVFNSRLVMERYLGGSFAECPAAYAASSPVNYVSSQTVPTLMIHGQNDVLVAYEHSKRLNAKLQEMKIIHYLLTLPWATHGFDYNINGPGGQLSTYAVLRFLQAVTH